jgi:predicted exporter
MRAAWIAAPAEQRARFVVWAVAMAALLLVFGLSVLPNLRVETDILALLPRTQQDAALDDALDAFSGQLARRQLYLIGNADSAQAKAAARVFADQLRASGAFARVDLELSGAIEQRLALYLAHSAYLLAERDATLLAKGETATLSQQALRAAFTPAGLIQPINLARDPLGLLNRFLQGQRLSLGNAQLDGTMLIVQHDATTFVLVSAESAGSPFASSVQEKVLPAIAQATLAARAVADIEMVSSGAIQHAAAATVQAEKEISLFGSLELLGVIVLLTAILGAVRPLALAAVTLTLATVAAFTAVHFLFGTVHILALVFGSSLIGSVIDYSIHFFTDRFRDPLHWTPAAAVRHVGGAILLGLLTTMIGYAVLALVPFPGLKQIAVFCAVGLATGCACVLCAYPLFAQPGRKPPPKLGAHIGASIGRVMASWQWTTTRIVFAIVLIVTLLLGLTRANWQDDIRALQSSPPALVQQEQRMRELLGSGVETRFYLVTGGSEQAVLDAERQLTAKLRDLVATGALSSYQAISQYVPPLAEQANAHRLLQQHVYSANGMLKEVMGRLGFTADAIERRRAEFAASHAPLSLADWLDSPASEGARHLWLGNVGHQFASVVTLGGIHDVAALTALSMGPDVNVRLVDRVASTSDILRSYRRAMTMLLAVIYLVAGGVLMLRFGVRDAPRMLLPSALATAVTLGVFGWCGVPINLFTLLALWLVLGLGIDYGIFLRHGQAARDVASLPTAILSVTLSACTTLLAFGLLALSATPFIRSIGLTLLCAIILSWLFVLLSCLTGRGAPPTRESHG